MAANMNLLELNVDTLFEQHSIGDIEAINKRVQGVIEQKREELRTMVGERYRDLLKAADTITAMKESSSDLIVQIENVTSNCRLLNEQQLIGFKTNEAEDILKNRQANKQLSNYFSTMVQIKLLIALPELIWSHLDEKNFYKATELFIFSRHISTGLQLDAGNILMQKLPIAKKQWEMLKPFQATIKKHIVRALEGESLNVQTTADCLLSLILLEKNDLNGVLKTLMKLRITAFHKCLKENFLASEQERRLVKDRILISLQILNGTLELISQCFMKKGLLLEKLKSLSDSNMAPSIALMDSNDSKYAYLLPEIISNFKPKIDLPVLDKKQARLDIGQWFQDIDVIISKEMRNLFDLISNLKTIQEIKNEAHKLEKHLNFAPFIEEFQISESLDFYKDKYTSLLNTRARDIVKDNLAKTIEATFQELKRNLDNLDQIQEVDIWADVLNDLPLSLAEALCEDIKKKRLLMKTKGFGPTIINLSSQFDKQLEQIIEEINILLSEETTKSEEKIILVDFLRDTTETQMTHFLTKLKELNHSNQQREEILFIIRCCAALLELCPHLRICFCQQDRWHQWIGKLSTPTNKYWMKFAGLYDEEIFNFWKKLVESILEECHCSKYLVGHINHDVILSDFALWEAVTSEEKDEQDNTVQSTFRIPKQPSISLQTYLFSLIRQLNQTIPQTMPTKVLNYFNNRLLTQILEHYQQKLEANVKTSLNSNYKPKTTFTSSSIPSSTNASNNPNESSDLSEQISDCQNNAARNVTILATAAATQNVSLQLYFDLKFLQSIFNISREDRSLLGKFTELQNAYKDLIDPFDYELFAEHIRENVKRSVLRLNCALGVLTPNDISTTITPAATVVTTTPAGAGTGGGVGVGALTMGNLAQEKEPNVLSLSSCGATSLWFPLLPIVNSTNTKTSEAANVDIKKPTPMDGNDKSTTPTRQKAMGGNSATSSSATTATTRKSDSTKSKSFFGAMSQEWFR